MSFFSRSALNLVKGNKILSRSALHLSKYDVTLASPAVLTRCLTRSLVVLASPPSKFNNAKEVFPSSLCGCGCGINGMHTKGDRELVEFLHSEIVAEKKNLVGGGSTPASLDDFSVKCSESELTLSKTFQDEEITISLNVNHTVESEPVADEQNTQQDDGLQSQPSFEIDIKIGSKTLSFTCNYLSQSEMVQDPEGAADLFGISEVTFHQGDFSDSTYCVSGDILDEMLYDLFMNMLDERGINNEFAQKLSEFCSIYEHSQYIKLLENIQNFVKRK